MVDNKGVEPIKDMTPIQRIILGMSFEYLIRCYEALEDTLRKERLSLQAELKAIRRIKG